MTVSGEKITAPRWTPSEDAIIVASEEWDVRVLMQKLPGRTFAAVKVRRNKLAPTGRKFRGSMVQPGLRTLIAKTCSACGQVRPGDWFYKTGARYRMAECKLCLSERGRVWRDEGGRASRVQTLAKQKRSQDEATRNRYEYVEQDMIVLADGELTAFEKSVILNRSYMAVLSAVNKYGFSSKRQPMQDVLSRERWSIQEATQ